MIKFNVYYPTGGRRVVAGVFNRYMDDLGLIPGPGKLKILYVIFTCSPPVLRTVQGYDAREV